MQTEKIPSKRLTPRQGARDMKLITGTTEECMQYLKSENNTERMPSMQDSKEKEEDENKS